MKMETNLKTQESSHYRIKMTKWFLYFIPFLLIMGCNDQQKDSQDDEKESLEYSFDGISQEVTNIIDNENLDTIQIAKLTPFHWDSLYIFKPYTSMDSVHSVLGYKWEGFNNTTIDRTDGINLLLFTENDSVINYIRWPRNKGDFLRVQSICFTPMSGVFSIERVKQLDQDWVFLDQK